MAKTKLLVFGLLFVVAMAMVSALVPVDVKITGPAQVSANTPFDLTITLNSKHTSDLPQRVQNVQFYITSTGNNVQFSSGRRDNMASEDEDYWFELRTPLPNQAESNGQVWNFKIPTGTSPSFETSNADRKVFVLTATASAADTIVIGTNSVVNRKVTNSDNDKTATFTISPTSLAFTIQSAVPPPPADCTAANWQLSDWNACLGACGSQGTQTRMVTKSGDCQGGVAEPAASQDCTTPACPPDCVPTTCAIQNKNCGSIADGCDGQLICGDCAAEQTCQDNNCVASPISGDGGAETGGAGGGSGGGGQASKAQALQQTCQSITNADFKQEGALGKIVSKLAKKLKDLFS